MRRRAGQGSFTLLPVARLRVGRGVVRLRPATDGARPTQGGTEPEYDGAFKLALVQRIIDSESRWSESECPPDHRDYPAGHGPSLLGANFKLNLKPLAP